MRGDDILMGFEFAILDEVVTASEVRDIWRKSNVTVMMAIYRGQLIARQTGEHKAWLVLRSSVIELWGNPPEGQV